MNYLYKYKNDILEFSLKVLNNIILFLYFINLIAINVFIILYIFKEKIYYTAYIALLIIFTIFLSKLEFKITEKILEL